jgi:hypothetical protein
MADGKRAGSTEPCIVHLACHVGVVLLLLLLCDVVVVVVVSCKITVYLTADAPTLFTCNDLGSCDGNGKTASRPSAAKVACCTSLSIGSVNESRGAK